MKKIIFSVVATMLLSTAAVYANGGKKGHSKQVAKTSCCTKANCPNPANCNKTNCPIPGCICH